MLLLLKGCDDFFNQWGQNVSSPLVSPFFKEKVHPKMKILSLSTRPHEDGKSGEFLVHKTFRMETNHDNSYLHFSQMKKSSLLQ